MANYPKNPLYSLPSGQKIPSSWQNRRTPFDGSPVPETGFALQDSPDAMQMNAEQGLHGEVVDGIPGNASE